MRQEDLVLSESADGWDAAIPARVATIVYQGAIIRYVVEAAGTRVNVLADKAATVEEGASVQLCWKRDSAIVL